MNLPPPSTDHAARLRAVVASSAACLCRRRRPERDFALSSAGCPAPPDPDRAPAVILLLRQGKRQGLGERASRFETSTRQVNRPDPKQEDSVESRSGTVVVPAV